MGWKNEPIRHSLASMGVRTSSGRSKVAETLKKPPRDIKLTSNEYNIDNLSRIIKLFWWCHHTGEWQWFNFDRAFTVAEEILYEKLGNHFRLPEREQKQYLKKNLERTGELKGKVFFIYYLKFMTTDPIEKNKIVDELLSPEVKKRIKNDLIPAYAEMEDREITVDWVKEQLKSSNKTLMFQQLLSYSEFEKSFVEFASSDNFKPNGIYSRIYNTWQKIRETHNIETVHEQKLAEKIALFDELIDLVHHNQEEVFSECIAGRIPDLRDEFEEEYI